MPLKREIIFGTLSNINFFFKCWTFHFCIFFSQFPISIVGALNLLIFVYVLYIASCHLCFIALYLFITLCDSNCCRFFSLLKEMIGKSSRSFFVFILSYLKELKVLIGKLPASGDHKSILKKLKILPTAFKAG